jgi:uncharacterized repeat protein (TIGR03803 family)
MSEIGMFEHSLFQPPPTPGCGTIFAITQTGDFASLHNFCSANGCIDGAAPVGGLIQANNGAFYGTTAIGGANNMGEVYRLSVGLGPLQNSANITESR